MHPVKRHILYQLILHPRLNFAKLKPNNTEGNVFTYHLKQLISESLVQFQELLVFYLVEETKMVITYMNLEWMAH